MVGRYVLVLWFTVITFGRHSSTFALEDDYGSDIPTSKKALLFGNKKTRIIHHSEQNMAGLKRTNFDSGETQSMTPQKHEHVILSTGLYKSLSRQLVADDSKFSYPAGAEHFRFMEEYTKEFDAPVNGGAKEIEINEPSIEPIVLISQNVE
ncbi:hypothetical protein RF11_04082 [Thelohanellus kitauei]|uniref:Uncharacterized protein n=1 Tax=Thelohanellus kitauei TaxID=669202 RepID=A0A0C2IVU2_THEKT|nr:hypothetical protein RF11_04082 [Thelohanellus kitauei]